ncbi:uncharacterized protein [Venturia canescens]|uniref:uncharacterized protein n=1 Tax=Venturia canescens TaxID=32260 RepID=UPI001C9D6086|nr:uncharacterized protein LOC122415218 [Venturia canescens]
MALTSSTAGYKFMTSALVDIYDSNRRRVRCRALLDTCSTANLITEKLATTLRLPKTQLSISVGGINEMTTASKHVITATIKSIHDGFEKTLTFLTIPRITDSIPTESMPKRTIAIPANIRMADPEFYKSAEPEILISAGPTLSMLSIGQIDLSAEGSDLLLQKTRLGWVLGGDVSNDRTPTESCLFTNLQDDLVKFWDVEEGNKSKHWSTEELACEEHFRKNVKRDNQGRYIVALPFKQGHPSLGESRGRAIKQLNALSRRLNSNEELRQQYAAGFQEYIRLEHVSEIINDNGEGFYGPHHPVIKEDSETTKVRMVYNASAKTSNDVSLNDALMVGPTIQDDIFTLLLRFRMYNYVITADIEKMYRQFMVRGEDRKYQKILWQGPNGVQTFEYNRLVFGVASAPFLAIRCLHQLADDEKGKFPRQPEF